MVLPSASVSLVMCPAASARNFVTFPLASMYLPGRGAMIVASGTRAAVLNRGTLTAYTTPRVPLGKKH